MEKKIRAIVVAGTIVIIMCSCGSREAENIDGIVKVEDIQDIDNIQDDESNKDIESTQGIESNLDTENMENSTNEISFADFHNLEFWFTSGHGGWATIMTINEDGSFSGEFFDGDLGVTGEGYPNGTMYQSNFTGQFTQPVKVNEYTYSMQISEMNYGEEFGKEEIIDGMLYCYTDAYGLEGSEEILIYLPGAPLAELPEEFRSWVDYYDLSNTTETELPFYALNNEPNQYGFYSFDIIEHVKESIASTEKYTASLENSIVNDALTQTEMNERTKEIYDEWDHALNSLWKVLKQIKSEEEMESITSQERAWIAYKEEAVAEAGAQFEGGSMQAMVVNQKAAELTKNRVYQLMGLLD